MTQTDPGWIQAATDHPQYLVALAAITIAGLLAALAAARQATAGVDRADLLTYLAASIATAVSAQGMWRFFRDVLHFETFLRIGVFGFIEIAVLASAVRARRSVRASPSRPAGLDGVAVWVLTALTGSLAALHAASFAEAVFRLTAPLVAAWLWERGMGAERRATGRGGIHWRITPERALVRLGLAEATGRTAGQVDIDRRITRLAIAVKRSRDLQNSRGRAWLKNWRTAGLTAAMKDAVEHTDLASDPEQQARLIRQIAALTNAEALVGAAYAAPWSTSALPATKPEVHPRQDCAPHPSALPSAALPAPEPQSAPAPEPTTAAPDPSPADSPGPSRRRRTRTDAELLEELRELTPLPSIRAIARDKNIGQARAKNIHEIESQRRKKSQQTEDPALNQNKINNSEERVPEESERRSNFVHAYATELI